MSRRLMMIVAVGLTLALGAVASNQDGSAPAVAAQEATPASELL
jgi:hypothetical protein